MKYAVAAALAALFALLGAAPQTTLTVTVQASPTPGTMQVYDGCDIFPSYSFLNTKIATAALDANSAAKIQAMVDADNSNGFSGAGFNSGGGGVGLEHLNVDANDSATKYTVNPSGGTGHSFGSTKFPWASGYFIENASDAHSLVLDTAGAPGACHLYELYNTAFSGSALSAYSGDAIDLSKESNANVTMGGATAARTSLFIPSIKYTELKAGAINHVIDLIQPEFSNNTQPLGLCNVFPATGDGGLNYGGPSGDTQRPCMGTHFRLHAGFTSSACASGDGLTVITALKQFGGYFDDSGRSGYEVRYIDNDYGQPSDGSSWANAANACLGTVHVTDFDIIAQQSAGGP